MNIRRILVAVDGSKLAMYATEKAIDLAKIYGAELSALMLSHLISDMVIREILCHQEYSPGSLTNFHGLRRKWDRSI
jgi:nucleotide-binding universal stress UspA family protein